MDPRTNPRTPPRQLPKVVAAEKFTMQDVLSATTQLKDIFIRETESLRTMKVKELGLLQQEKERLTKLLESYQAILKKNPNAFGEMDEEAREAFEVEMQEFTEVVDENYRRVAVARAVNQRIVQAILDVVTEQQHAGTYTKQGVAAAPNMALSFNLNHQA